MNLQRPRVMLILLDLVTTIIIFVQSLNVLGLDYLPNTQI